MESNIPKLTRYTTNSTEKWLDSYLRSLWKDENHIWQISLQFLWEEDPDKFDSYTTYTLLLSVISKKDLEDFKLVDKQTSYRYKYLILDENSNVISKRYFTSKEKLLLDLKYDLTKLGFQSKDLATQDLLPDFWWEDLFDSDFDSNLSLPTREEEEQMILFFSRYLELFKEFQKTFFESWYGHLGANTLDNQLRECLSKKRITYNNELFCLSPYKCHRTYDSFIPMTEKILKYSLSKSIKDLICKDHKDELQNIFSSTLDEVLKNFDEKYYESFKKILSWLVLNLTNRDCSHFFYIPSTQLEVNAEQTPYYQSLKYINRSRSYYNTWKVWSITDAYNLYTRELLLEGEKGAELLMKAFEQYIKSLHTHYFFEFLYLYIEKCIKLEEDDLWILISQTLWLNMTQLTDILKERIDQSKKRSEVFDFSPYISSIFFDKSLYYVDPLKSAHIIFHEKLPLEYAKILVLDEKKENAEVKPYLLDSFKDLNLPTKIYDLTKEEFIEVLKESLMYVENETEYKYKLSKLLDDLTHLENVLHVVERMKEVYK